jgi:CHAT domain-containing protein
MENKTQLRIGIIGAARVAVYAMIAPAKENVRGTRAILVTNWSVHSASARELVTDLFRRQAADASITRAEALRQAMMDMLDRGGFSDGSGKLLFTYAHPLVWAPYAIIGDGGAR